MFRHAVLRSARAVGPDVTLNPQQVHRTCLAAANRHSQTWPASVQHRSFVLLILCIACAVMAVASLPAEPALSRVVIITEATPSPGSNATQYAICSTRDLAVFTADLVNASSTCGVKPTSLLAATELPTITERRALCGCRNVVLQVQKLKIPRCSLFRDGRETPYAQVIEYAFALCDRDGSASDAPPASVDQSPSTAPAEVPNTGTREESKSTSHVGLIVGIVAGAVVVLVIVSFFLYKRRRGALTKNDPFPLTPTRGTEGAYTQLSPTVFAPAYPVDTGKAVETAPTSSHDSMRPTGSTSGTTLGSELPMRASMLTRWDVALLAVRVPCDTVYFGPLLSRGGYGEVYKGTYRGEPVAIKQLLPERRKDLAQIDAFFREVQLMSTLQHERIINFIAVAWNALSDACVVVEYMENGDLRSVLTRWELEEQREPGFDAEKVMIALHIAHALTYLHSLQPMVVHRDLKSKNVLLDTSYNAKLTDFGVAREGSDSTMTAGVGTSLWIAPEVMLGERYDEKADVFSFGVVLSELDSHRLPYADTKEAAADHTIPDTAILQLVSLGRLEISFTANAHVDLVHLGRDCVQLDPKQRPSSAHVLHRVSEILHRDFSS